VELFEQRLLAEGVRAIEGDSPSLSTKVLSKSNQSFEERLLTRAQSLDIELQLSPLLGHFKALSKRLFSVLAILLIILGASSVQQLFFTEQGTQINFFWAFALFFIPNILSLCFWILLFFRNNIFNGTWLTRFSLFLLTMFEKRFNPTAKENTHFWPVFRRYFQINFSGALGRYQLSVLHHFLWLSYFFGATLMLVLMLATHQVDFVWQTSILSLDNFQWLTKVLAYVPDLLGVTVPDPAAIQHSNITLINSMGHAELSRFAWSSLLISSLLIYGIIPRFLLWFVMRFLLVKKQKSYQLNFSHPYYVQLRQQLKPNVTSLGISDPDTITIKHAERIDQKTGDNSLPTTFFPVAIELSESELELCDKHIKQSLVKHLKTPINICDFQEQQTLLQELVNVEQQSIVLYVSISRVPDRGLSSFITDLISGSNKIFYLLLIDQQINSLNIRRSDWYHLAQKVGIPLDNIIHLKINSLENYE
jgi:hypothetical protein